MSETIKAKSVRCAVYTRVSTDAGLGQEFNSLDAQHEASSAYIRSQAHAGWTTVKNRTMMAGSQVDRPSGPRCSDCSTTSGDTA